MEATDLQNNMGFGTISYESIEQIRGDRFNTNFGNSGFNGKNIVFTGRMKVATVTIQGISRQSIRFEVIYFTGSIQDGKVGSITLSSLMNRQMIIGETETTQIIEGANQYSEKELLKLLTDGKHYLRFVSSHQTATPTFTTNDGRTTVDYDTTKPKTGYKYQIAVLTTEQQKELANILEAIFPRPVSNPQPADDSQPEPATQQ